MRRLHNIFWLPGDYSLVPAGSIVTAQHDPGVNDPLSGLTGAFLTERGLRVIVQLPVDNAALTNPAGYVTRLDFLRGTLAARGIVPWAIQVGDEVFDCINHPSWLAWPCFAGMTRVAEDMQARKDWAYPRLRELFARTAAAFPTVPTMQVETKINEERASGPGLWYPDLGADILGIDAYLWADGCPWLGTPPLAGAGPDKFGMEVGWMVAGTPAGFTPRVTGAFATGKPVVLIAQAFHDVTGQWHALPSVTQLRWYFEWGVSQPQIVGLGWYSIYSVPGLSVGLDQLPEHYAAVLGAMAEMAAGVPVPDPLPAAAAAPAPGPTPPSPPAPTTPTQPSTLCTIAVRTDSTLVITSAGGRVQTITL